MKYLPAVFILCVIAVFERPAAAGSCQALRYTFTPDCFSQPGDTVCAFHADQPDFGPQIAVWVESADRSRFVDTLQVTNAVALFGIGNRPGLWNLRSGPKFPYGRRPMALPVWAHARGETYPLVVMQDGQDGLLTAHEADSSPEPYFCRPMLPTEVVDAITCPSGQFRSDKGKLDQTQVSFYPPRADLLDFGQVCPALPNHPGGSCNPGDSPQYAFLNDVDTVAAATPSFGQTGGGLWDVPDSLPAGDYALMVEVAKEFDTNATYAATNAPSLDFEVFGDDGNVGQPSVVFRVPFSVGPGAPAVEAATTSMYGYGDYLGDSGTLFPPDGSVTSGPGSGEGRLALTDGAGGMGRVHLSLAACAPVDCTQSGPPPAVPIQVVAGSVTGTSATVRILNVSDGGGPVAAYELRFALIDSQGPVDISEAQFVRWTPVPPITPGTPGVTSDQTLAGLAPLSQYAVGVRAIGQCGTSAVSYARFFTPRQVFQQLHGCFIATAAFGSDLAPEVNVLRRARDRAVGASGLARLAAELYARDAPAAARALGETAVGRALVRGPLRPLAAIAGAALRL